MSTSYIWKHTKISIRSIYTPCGMIYASEEKIPILFRRLWNLYHGDNYPETSGYFLSISSLSHFSDSRCYWVKILLHFDTLTFVSFQIAFLNSLLADSDQAESSYILRKLSFEIIAFIFIEVCLQNNYIIKSLSTCS